MKDFFALINLSNSSCIIQFSDEELSLSQRRESEMFFFAFSFLPFILSFLSALKDDEDYFSHMCVYVYTCVCVCQVCTITTTKLEAFSTASLAFCLRSSEFACRTRRRRLLTFVLK